jgi:nondiscriminating glutamyl-tRNA synthetase
MWCTRIAPSPTGLFHLGTARTAYLCWLAAHASGGEFILRIDDTDVDRNTEEARQVIVDSLEWLGLIPDRVYTQTNRMDFYRMFTESMLQGGGAEKREDGAIMLMPPATMPSSWVDTIAGDIAVTQNVQNQIANTMLVRPDGMPTYNFASIIDDFTTGVNWIIRGHDHISNTPKQIAIWHAIYTGNMQPDPEIEANPEPITIRPLPGFTHVGLIHKDGKKLSKRDAAASLLSYRDAGYNPDAILSFLIRMGWSPKVDDKSTKIITREQALDLFFEGSLRASAAQFDQKRLDNIQANYEKMLKTPPDQWMHKREKKNAAAAASSENAGEQSEQVGS